MTLWGLRGIMGLERRREWRSRGWWAVFLCAFLAMGVYIAFDVLDLDGSNFRNPGPRTAISAEAAPSEAERFLHRIPPIAGSPGLASAAIAIGFASETSQLTRRAASAILAFRPGRSLPRMGLGHEASSATPSTDDPA
jgi:hypothetical protein